MRVSSDTNGPFRRAGERRRARWGRFRRWGLSAAALGLPFAALPADPANAQALPTGGNVVGGSGTISQTSSNQLTINQSSSTLSVDWQSFSVGAGNIVRFNQPSSSALALNRVVGPDPSTIFGSIQANGRVVLMNPAGIYFGPSAMVDVNGLVATTSRMSQADFLAGNLNFSLAGDVNARVINEGLINVAQGGFAVLSAAAVENKGTIVAQGGTVVLAGTPTFTLDFFGDGLLKFASTGTVNQAPTGATALVENSGTIQADGGRVLMTARAARDVINNVINVTGIVEARSARVENGEIVIDGGENGIVSVNASLDVSGTAADAKGGTIKVLGEKVGLFENARLDASGDAGGGTVLVGGNYQGKGPEANAKMVFMDARAVIDASSALADGGRVILWSDEATRNAGHIDVSGAVNGGFIEVSSKGFLDFRGTVGLQGATGNAGALLLDPTDITITASASSGDMSGTSPFAGSNATSNLNVAVLNAALTGGTVTITTASAGAGTGNIDITAGIVNGAANTTLILRADGAITIGSGGSINSGGYLLNVSLRAAGNINVGGSGINTSGGYIETTGTSGSGLAGGNFVSTANINATSGHVTLQQTGTIAIGGTLNTSGIVTVNAGGATTQTAAITGSGSLFVGGTGAVTLSNGSNAFGSITLNRAGTGSNSIDLTTSISPNIQTSTLGSGTFSLTGVGFAQSGAITQDASGGTVTIAGGTGTVTLSQSNTWSGDLTVTGGSITTTGGGISQTFFSAGTKTATFTQTGAGGTMSLSNITAGAGSINVVGNADAQLSIGGNITTLGGNVTLYADAPGGITGSGMGTGNRNGVSILSGADLNAGGGNITIVGRSGNSSNNVGVSILGAQVRTSGTGYISIEGLGTSAGGGHSIVVENSSVTSTSATGSIAFMGSNPGGGAAGLSLKGASVMLGGASFQNNLIFQVDSITNSATSLSLTRQAGGGTVTFLTLFGGDVILNGTGSGLGVTSDILSGISNFGTIQIGSASATGNVSVGAAYTAPNNTNLSLIGTGSGTATVGYALTTQGTGSLTVSGDAGVAINANLTTGGGDILVKGNVASWTSPFTNTAPTFGSATGTFAGVSIGSGVSINAVGGNIAIGGKGGTSGIDQHGVSMTANSSIQTSGTGTINIAGQGGASASNGGGAGTGGAHTGLYFNGGAAGTPAQVISANGGITLTGTGGGTAGTSDNNGGVALLYSSVRATGTGAIDITGTAGFGASRGVVVVIDPTAVASVAAAGGNITIVGTGGGTAAEAHGFVSYGVHVDAYTGTASIVSTGAGDIVLRGVEGSAGTGMIFSGANVTLGGASASGNMTLIADTLASSATTLAISGSGAGVLVLRPDTNSTAIGVNGGAGTLQISNSILSAVAPAGFTYLQIGSASQTGTITTGGTWALGLNTELITGASGAITLGNTALTNKTLFLSGGGAATQSTSTAITGTGGTLVVGGIGSGAVTLTESGNSFGLLTLARTGNTGNVTVSTTADLQIVGGLWSSGAMDITANSIVTNGVLTSSGGSLELNATKSITVTQDISTSGGAILLLGNATWGTAPTGTPNFGAATGDFVGVNVAGGAINAGPGGIYIAGAGGNDTNGFQHGVWINAGGSVTASGEIKIYGQGGTNFGGDNSGVIVTGAGSMVNGGAGGVTVVGSGGTGAGGYQNHGVFLEYSGTIAVNGGGTLQITGTGGATGTNSSGLYLNDGGVVSSISGNVTITASAIDYDAVALPNGTLSVGGAGTLTINASAPSATSISMGSSGSISTGSGMTTLNVDSDISFTSAPLALGGGLTIVSTATAGGMSIDNAANSIAGTTTITGPHINLAFRNSTSNANLVVNGSGAVTLGAIDVEGALTVNSVGAITQTGAISSAGLATFDADSAGNVTLNNLANDFGHSAAGPTVVVTNVNNATVWNANAIVFGTSNVAGMLDAKTASGGISQSTGATMSVTGTTALTVNSSGGFLFNNTGNDFVGAVSVTTPAGWGGTIRTTNDLHLGVINVGGAFSAYAGSGIDQSGALTIGAGSSFSTTTGTIALTESGNSFGGAVALSAADDTAITSGGSLMFNTVSVSGGGNLTVNAVGSIAQTNSISVAGTTALTAGGGIDLSASGNMFTGAVYSTSSAGGSIQLTGDALFLGTTVSAGNLILNATSGGIAQNALLTVNGNLNASATGGPIALATLNNIVAGSVSLATTGGSNIAWGQSGPLLIGSISSSGTLNVSVTGGAITQVGALTTAGAVDISADTGNITLTNASNAFGGPLTLYAASGSASITTAGALTIASIDVANSLALTVGGAITQSGAIQVGTGTTSLAATGTMTLTDGGNDFGSALALTGVGGQLEGMVNGNTGPSAAADVTAVGNGFTFNSTAIANSGGGGGGGGSGGTEGTTTSTVSTETLAQLITQILTSTVTSPSSSTATTDAANANPVSPAAVQAMLVAILAEAAGSTGGEQGGGETSNANTGGPGTTSGTTGATTPAAGTGTFAAGTTITINTSGGAVQSITVTPVGGGAPVTILPGLLNLTPPAIPTASATGTPGISGNFPLSWRQ